MFWVLNLFACLCLLAVLVSVPLLVLLCCLAGLSRMVFLFFCFLLVGFGGCWGCLVLLFCPFWHVLLVCLCFCFFFASLVGLRVVGSFACPLCCLPGWSVGSSFDLLVCFCLCFASCWCVGSLVCTWPFGVEKHVLWMFGFLSMFVFLYLTLLEVLGYPKRPIFCIWWSNGCSKEANTHRNCVKWRTLADLVNTPGSCFLMRIHHALGPWKVHEIAVYIYIWYM